jgi:hypothetical protein
MVKRGADAPRSLALHSASRCRDLDKSRAMACHLLDKHNMDININNETFRDFMHDSHDTGSPLCSAVIHCNLAAVQELLQRCASFSGPRSWPVSYAVRSGEFLPALEPLLRAGTDPTQALMSSVGAAKTCLEFGANPAAALSEALEEEKCRLELAAEAAAYGEEQSDEQEKN